MRGSHRNNIVISCFDVLRDRDVTYCGKINISTEFVFLYDDTSAVQGTDWRLHVTVMDSKSKIKKKKGKKILAVD
jgi:hypothetical protein